MLDTSVLKGVPEFFESELGESIVARTEVLSSFRELGAPDVCHVVKCHTKNPNKEVGSYHYVLGVDASSSATIAAYLTSLNYILEESQAWAGTKSVWRIKSGTFCCFNAFSRVDVRVEVKIPGGVECYLVDLKGDRHPILNQAIWSETAISAAIRTILDDNDEADANGGNTMGLRKLDPLPTPKAEQLFLEMATTEFWKGWQLGTDPEVQVATYFNNHLTNALLKYFSESARMDKAAEFFKPLFQKDAEVGASLARSYFESNQEIKGVQTLYDALKRNPLSYGLLLAQIDFLLSKNRPDLALKLAKLAVTYAPSEYYTWAKLTEVYIALGDINSALLSLNSCPMFSFTEKDCHKMPPAFRTHLPMKPSGIKDEELKKQPPVSGMLEDANDPKEDEVHPELQRLPALSLRGTFYKAYLLLTKISKKTGWDELLKHRSTTFVMEEEYRMHRAMMEERTRILVDKDEMDQKPKGIPGSDVEDADEVSSLKSLREQFKTAKTDFDIADAFQDSGSEYGEVEPRMSPAKSASSIDKRAVSPAKSFERNSPVRSEKSSPTKSVASDKKAALDPGQKSLKLRSSASSIASSKRSQRLSIDLLMEKASEVASSDVEPEVKTEEKPPNPRLSHHSVSFSFKSKRLCEKWLDNLFMVLYNDLRIYTALKQQITHYKNAVGVNSSGLQYRKTGAEWEVYADLALRLGHEDDAIEAYQQCLEQKFSSKSLLKLLELFSKRGLIQETLTYADRIVTAWDRIYVELTYPSSVARAICRLVKKHGLSKIQNALLAMNLPQRRYKLMTRYFEYAELFQCEGYDA